MSADKPEPERQSKGRSPRKLKWQVEHLYTCEIGASLSLQVMERPTDRRFGRYYWAVFRHLGAYSAETIEGGNTNDLAVATTCAEQVGRTHLAQAGRAKSAVLTSKRLLWVCSLEWVARTRDGYKFAVHQTSDAETHFYALSLGTSGYALQGTAPDLSTALERCEEFAANRRNHLAATVREPVSDARAA